MDILLGMSVKSESASPVSLAGEGAAQDGSAFAGILTGACQNCSDAAATKAVPENQSVFELGIAPQFLEELPELSPDEAAEVFAMEFNELYQSDDIDRIYDEPLPPWLGLTGNNLPASKSINASQVFAGDISIDPSAQSMSALSAPPVPALGTSMSSESPIIDNTMLKQDKLVAANLTPNQPPVFEEITKTTRGVVPILDESVASRMSPLDKMPQAPSDFTFEQGLISSKEASLALKPELLQNLERVMRGKESFQRIAAMLNSGAGSAEVQSYSIPVLATNTNTEFGALMGAGDRPSSIPLFGGQVAERLGQAAFSMIKSNIQQAEIRLDPPDLGPMEIQIEQEGKESKIHFVVNHAVTKDVIESALGRLRDIFESGGLKLTDVLVEQRDSSDRDNSTAQKSGKGQGSGPSQENRSTNTLKPLHQNHQGLFDGYA